MADKNVIRQDVVQISFDVLDNPMKEVQDMVNSLAAEANKATQSVDGITDAAKETAGSMSDIVSEAKEVTSTVNDVAAETKETAENAKEVQEQFTAISKAISSGITTKIKSLPKAVQSSATAAREFAASLRANPFGTAISGVNKLKNSFKTLRKNVKNVPTVLNTGLGKAVQTAKKLPSTLKASIVNGAVNGTKKLRAGFSQVIKTAQKLKQEVDKSTTSLEKAKNAASDLKGLIAGAAGAVGFGMGVDAAVDSVSNLQSSVNRLQAQTGASAEEMQQYGDIIKELYTDTMGESLADVSNTVGLVAQQFRDLDASQIKEIANGALLLRDTFDMDVNETLRGVNALMTNMGLTAEEAFDYIAKGAQNGLDKSKELTDNISEYSQIWSQAGFSAEEMFTVLQNGLDSGAYNLDKVNDFVKEFAISLSDGRIEKNLSSFSKDTQNLFQKWQKGGASQKDVFNSIINDLSGMKDEQQALTLASEVWSALGEDNAMSVITSLNKVNDTYKDVEGTMQGINDVRYNDVGSALTALKREGELLLDSAMTPILNKTIDVIGKIKEWGAEVGIIDTLKSAFGELKDSISPIIAVIGDIIGGIVEFGQQESVVNSMSIAFKGFKKIMSVVGKALGFVAENLDIILPLVIGLTTAFLTYKAVMIGITIATKAYRAALIAYETIMFIITAVTKGYTAAQLAANAAILANPLVAVITAIVVAIGILIGVIIYLVMNWDKVKKKAVEVWNKIKAVWGKVKEWFSQHVVTPTKQLFSDMWSGIKEIFSNVGSWFSEKFSEAYSAVTGAFSNVKDFFSGLWDDIKGIFTDIGVKIGDAVGGAFTAVINGVLEIIEGTINNAIGLINKAIGFINKALPKKHEIGTVGEVSLPRLAKGGIIEQPTIAQIGEAGKEAVLPLENNTGWIREIAKELAEFSGGNYGGQFKGGDNTTTTYKEYNQYNDYSPHFTLNMNGASATEDNKRKVKQWVKEAMTEMFDDLDRDNPPAWEV
jgi:phage-related minor tail protein